MTLRDRFNAAHDAEMSMRDEPKDPILERTAAFILAGAFLYGLLNWLMP